MVWQHRPEKCRSIQPVSVKEPSSQKKSNSEERQPVKRREPEQARPESESLLQPLEGRGLSGLPDESNSRLLRRSHILQLQRRYGNAYVQRLLAGQAKTSKGGGEAASGETDVGQVPVRDEQSPAAIQAKLGEGRPLDGHVRGRMESAEIVGHDLQRIEHVVEILNLGQWPQTRAAQCRSPAPGWSLPECPCRSLGYGRNASCRPANP